MVREIKNTLEAQQKIAMETASASAAAVAPIATPTTKQELAAIEKEIDRVVEHRDAPQKAAAPTVVEEVEQVVEESPTQGNDVPTTVEPAAVPAAVTEASVEPIPESSIPEAEKLAPEEEALTPEEQIAVAQEAVTSFRPYGRMETWQEKASYIANDIMSERVISMRRIDYTTAILQGAAAGAVITATLIAMFRPN